MIIEDGKGTGFKSKVDGAFRLHTQSVSETEAIHAIELGDGYNLNTGNITFSAAGTLIYLENNEDVDLVIEAIALGTGTGTTSDMGELTIERNITGGDLLSDATAIAINQNRNLGSSKTLSGTVYSGKSGGTSTGGDDLLYFYTGTDTRLFAPINLILTKGSNIAVTYDPKLSAGSIKAYCALVCYLKDVNSAD
jgi:hypothetical protein